MKDNNISNKLTYSLFAVYLIALIWILLFKLGVHFSNMGNSRSINLIPYSDFFILNGKIDYGGMIMNILIFVPLGVYAGILFKRWIVGKKILLFFLVSLIIEGFQFILALGVFDVMDMINNTLGGIIGLMIYVGIDKIFNNSIKAQKFINIIAAIGTLTMIILLFMLKTNRLGIRYQ